MIEFPYGIADFRRIRRQGFVYVDRTAYIRDLERLGSVLVFLRPRRFGKSLWLQTLANYYDLRRQDEFDGLFGELAIGRRPTRRANRYFILQWNFSTVDPSDDVERIAASLREHVRTQAQVFAREYQGVLSAPIEVDGSPAAILRSILVAVSETPHTLYLLIDEYDNFVNEVMATDVDTYRALFGKDGPYRQLFKSVKSATEGQGLERVFVTGVSPVALNDLTNGFNIAKNVSLEPEVVALCGFQEAEIRHLLELVAGETSLPTGSVDGFLDTMRTWYNGYRFHHGPASSVGDGARPHDPPDLIYNPTNVLYFLDHLYRRGSAPEKLHDENLRTGRGKLVFLARTAAGADVIEELTESGDGTIEIPRLEASFSLDDLTTRIQGPGSGRLVPLLHGSPDGDGYPVPSAGPQPGRTEALPRSVARDLTARRRRQLGSPGGRPGLLPQRRSRAVAGVLRRQAVAGALQPRPRSRPQGKRPCGQRRQRDGRQKPVPVDALRGRLLPDLLGAGVGQDLRRSLPSRASGSASLRLLRSTLRIQAGPPGGAGEIRPGACRSGPEGARRATPGGQSAS